MTACATAMNHKLLWVFWIMTLAYGVSELISVHLVCLVTAKDGLVICLL